MKKKFLIIAIFILIILLIGLVFYFNSKSKNQDEFTEQELTDMEYVDNRISELMTSENYKELNLEDQVSEMELILKQLKKEKKIKNFSYESSSYMFGFEYSCGVLGGIMMKDFDPLLN